MFIVMLGMQGSGKGTQSDLLAEKTNVPHLSTGDMFRAIAKQDTDFGRHIKTLIEGGTYVSDEETTRVLREQLPTSCILDGYPRTLAQAHTLDTLAQVSKAVLIDLSEEEAVRRMMGRGRADDNEEAIRKRLAQYHASADAIIDYYQKQGKLVRIDGEQSVETVFADLCGALHLQ